MLKFLSTGAAAALLLSTGAHAATVDAIITADNHYAVYSTGNTGVVYHGGNELGSGGSSGTYNWSVAEAHTFEAAGRLYIAAWSDDSIAQGLLAQILIDGAMTLHSGDAKWEVYCTGANRGDSSSHPSTLEMDGHILTADTGNLWETPFIGGANGTGAWGPIAGITNDARWMWCNVPGDDNPLDGGSGYGEMLIFRVDVPAPGSAALIGLGGLTLIRRRRH